MKGRTLGHYSVGEKLGKGGMGEVYLAEDTKLGRQVALKVLPDEMAADPERRERFEREARAVAALNHPNIVTIHSVEEDEGVHFLTMEYVEGETLGRRIPRDGMQLSEFFDVAIPLADALAAAHQQGITHRDLKPDNVMVTGEGRVKVLDFGLAKLREPAPGEAAGATQIGTATFTGEGKIVGTVHYMSPEQAEGKPVDHRSDVFSLGIVLYQMATGEQPFQGDTPLATLSSILKETPIPLAERQGALPRHLGRVVHRCMEKSPDRRYQTALDVRNELEQLRTEVETGDRDRVTAPPAKPRRLGLIAGVAAAMLLLVAGAWFFGSRSGSRSAPTSAAAADNLAIGVIGFENLSDPTDADHFGRMLMSLVTTDLAESGGLRVISTAKVLAARRAAGIEGAFDAALATEAAKNAGADAMLIGQVMRDADRLLLTAELVDVDTGDTLDSLRREAASSSELFALAGSIAADVREHFAVASAVTSGIDFDLAANLTASPEAYRHFVTGEQELHRLHRPEAIAAFENAVRVDPTFAWAWYRLAKGRFWANKNPEGMDAYERGLEFVDRLPRRWQIVYRADYDYARGNTESAYASLTELIRSSPDIADAHYVLGEIKTHDFRYSDLLGSREHFERALDVDPGYKIVYFHLVQVYVRQNDLAAIERLIEQFRRDNADDPTLDELEVTRLHASGRHAEAIAWADGHLAGDVLLQNEGLWAALHQTGQWERLRERADGLAVVDPVATQRGLVFAWGGMFQSALDAFDRLIEEYRSVPDSIGNAAVWASRRARVLSWIGDTEGAIDAARLSVRLDPFSFVAQHGLVHVLFAADRLDDGRNALADFTAVAARSRSPEFECWLRLGRAEQHLALGDPQQAGLELEGVDRDRCLTIHADHGMLLGRVRDAQGDAQGALAAYRLVTDAIEQLVQELTPRIPAYYEVARLEEQQGNLDAARDYYRRYLDHWGNADRPIPQVAVAKTRLAELSP